MNVRFDQPVWWWLLVAVLPLTLLGVLWFTSMSPARRVSALLARFALYSLILAMLAGMAMVRKTDRIAVVALVDVSGSVRRYVPRAGVGGGDSLESREGLTAPNAAKEFLRRAMKGTGPDDLLGVIAFDGRAVAVAPPGHADPGARNLDVQMAEGTNIAEAIRLGRAMIPPDASGRLLLFSDGNQTAGDALAAATEGGDTSTGRITALPIDIAPLRYRLGEEVAVESVDAPPAAAAGAVVNVRVALSATAPAQGTLQLLRENIPVDLNGDEPGTGRRITLAAGTNVEVLEVKLDGGRVHRFRAVFEPDVVRDAVRGTRPAGDTTVENNAAEAFTITPGKGSALIVSTSGDGGTLARALRHSGVEATVAGPDGLPPDLLSMQAYDVVMLENVPAEAVPQRTQEMLAAYVRDMGGGLVMIGGPDSFGAGGWRGSPIEAMLPVNLEVPDKLITPEVAIVFVLDNSGSMGNFVLGATKTQQDIANEATALAIRTLDRRDLIGVITFNNRADTVWELQPNRNTAALLEAVDGIRAGGGTNMGPGLERAREQLKKSNAKVKHIVVLSDGKSQGSQALPEAADRLHAEGVKLSMIAVGDDADTRTMAEMASRGDGVFYHAITANQLPTMFLKAVRLVRTPLIRETPFDPVMLATGSAMTAGVESPPKLNGLTLTQARVEPTITNAIMTPGGEPVLAHWNVGLGQVAAFTSDASRWAEPWLAWPGYERLWTQIVRQTSRPPGSRKFQAASRAEGSTINLRLEAQEDDGRPMEGLDVPATVYSPNGEAQTVRLAQTGPGVYEGRAEATQTGSYVSLIKPAATAAGDQRRLTPVIVGSTIQEGAEYRAKEWNEALLTAMVQKTGGRMLDIAAPESANLFDRRATVPREAVTPMWRVLLVWTLGVFLLDVATRRVAWDRWTSKRFRRNAAADEAEAAQRGALAAATTGNLRAGRGAEPAAPAVNLALSDKDAADLAAAARDRRRADRLAAARNIVAPAATATPPLSANDPVATPAPKEEEGFTLLRAKRRASERFEQE